MYKPMAFAAAAALFALPAVAQTGGSQQSQSGASSGQSGAQQQTQGQRGGSPAMTQQKLRQSLEQAGFKNVQVIDAAYLVRAQTQDGEQVVMMINPPSAATMPSGSAGGQSGGTGQGGGSGSGSGSGGTTR